MACLATLDLRAARPSRGAHVVGFLNALNNTQPSAAAIAPLGMSMWRGPPNTWLWPNRTGCTERRSCCTTDSCLPPFYLAQRAKQLGLRQQYILGSLHRAVTRCNDRAMHGSPHNCSLPVPTSGPLVISLETEAHDVLRVTLSPARAVSIAVL